MQQKYDVAIVGYGPVGATLANMLGAEGLTVFAIDRERSVYHQPRAGHLDGEVMRAFQSIDVAASIASRSYVNPGMQFRSRDDELLLDWPRPPEIGPEGWHPSYRFHQPDLELELRQAAARRGSIDCVLGSEVADVAQRADGVTLSARNLETGDIRTIEARYVVGCDGARSMIRRCMGVAQEDLKSHEQWLIIDLKLDRPRPDLPLMTIQWCDPRRPMTMINMVGDRRRWEIMLLPGESPAEFAKPESFWPLIARWVRPEEATVERAVVYTFHSVIANRWRDRRMLLAGDACHQTPPFMGQGMCAGIRDAANLSWKLAAVLRGRAGDDLLDTYQEERAPHVRAFIETAVRLGALVHITDEAAAAERDAKLRENPGLMVTPSPRLVGGLQGDAPAPAGTRAPQLVLAEGDTLDDRAGQAFCLLVRASLLEEAGRGSAEVGSDGIVVIDDTAPSVAAFLAELQVDAIIVRPDRYVLGVAKNAAELRCLLGRVPGSRASRRAA